MGHDSWILKKIEKKKKRIKRNGNEKKNNKKEPNKYFLKEKNIHHF